VSIPGLIALVVALDAIVWLVVRSIQPKRDVSTVWGRIDRNMDIAGRNLAVVGVNLGVVGTLLVLAVLTR